MKVQTRNTLLLVLCALIWGLAFVAQSAGAALAPFAFLACRSWLGPERRGGACALRLFGLPQLAGGGLSVAAGPCL